MNLLQQRVAEFLELYILENWALFTKITNWYETEVNLGWGTCETCEFWVTGIHVDYIDRADGTKNTFLIDAPFSELVGAMSYLEDE